MCGLVVVSSKGGNELDLSLVKILLILLAYCFPLVVAIISLLFIKKLSPKECIFSGLFIIVLAALVMPLVTAMKGMDDFYQQKELLNAFEVVVKNQEILASKSYGGESVMISKIEHYMNDDEKKDYGNFRAFIDTYEIFLTFLGLSLGVNILCLGFSDKLTNISSCTHNDSSLNILSRIKTVENSITLVKAMLSLIIGLILVILLKMY